MDWLVRFMTVSRRAAVLLLTSVGVVLLPAALCRDGLAVCPRFHADCSLPRIQPVASDRSVRTDPACGACC